MYSDMKTLHHPWWIHWFTKLGLDKIIPLFSCLSCIWDALVYVSQGKHKRLIDKCIKCEVEFLFQSWSIVRVKVGVTEYLRHANIQQTQTHIFAAQI